MPLAAEIALYAVGINLVGFVAFGWDKFCAIRDLWRIPERTLLTLALIGGSPGVIAGQHLFRHKTRKEPFRTQLHLIVAIQAVALVVWAGAGFLQQA